MRKGRLKRKIKELIEGRVEKAMVLIGGWGDGLRNGCEMDVK